MAKSIYALLVGIDEYDPNSGVPSLRGCVNDIEAVEAYLRERVAKDSEWKLVEPADVPWILLNQQATRQAIIKGFREHLCNADSEDVVFFYYSGHGSQERAPEEFWSIEPDHLNETLVCYDSRTPGGQDLADKDLAYLISKVNQKDPHTVIVLDCCYSGNGIRDLEFSTRRVDIDLRERPLNIFLCAEDSAELNEMLTSSRSLKERTTVLTLPVPKGKYVAFLACHSHQLAKEYKGDDGKQRGAFSYFLLQTLQRTNGDITYRDLARSLNALVSGKVKEQSPQIEATDTNELDKPFLGGAIKPRASYFTLTYSKNLSSWVVDGGALHGIPKPSSGGDTLLAIFPVGATLEQLSELSNALADVKVTQVLPERTQVEIISGGEKLSENESYWAIVTSLPLKPLQVFIKGDQREEAGVDLVLQALKTANDGHSSLFVHPVDEFQDADYNLLVREGQYRITLPSSDRSLVAPIPIKPDQTGYTAERAEQVIKRLEHIARWMNILELTSPAASRIKPDDVEMEIIPVAGNEASSPNSDGAKKAASEMRLEYTYENGEWVSPALKIKLTNKSNKELYCNILNLEENFAVGVPFFGEHSERNIRIPPKGSEVSGTVESVELDFIIPDEYIEQGITEYKDIFKLIVSTTDFDGGLLKQQGLDLPPKQEEDSRLVPASTVNRLMNRVYTRHAIARSSGQYDDWMTKEIAVTVVRPQDAKPITPNERTVLQEGIVQLKPHPSLQAKANLTTVPQATRDIGNMVLPAILLQDPSVIQPFQFTSSCGSDPGLSGLELTDVEDYTVVTPEQPLQLLVDAPLGENEKILPVGYDGEFFLPLGRGKKTEDNQTEIQLNRLPKPTVSSRSLQGSIRIFFQKVITQKLGADFADEYPILASADVDEKGKVIYEKSQETLKGKVTQAQKIVLFIHGIIGDTASIAPCVQLSKTEVDGQTKTLRELYDLVLTFDYENLQTTVQENAKLLGQRLADVGLDPNHGKELHIVAHSMGGLVSRWFIEREGGNQVVQHLVMLGTPNGGSPWPAVQDWVFATLSIGLNQLSAIVWPTKVVAELLDFLEANDNSLAQMQPGSPILHELETNPDPGIPYTIIAGDRSVMAAALAAEPEKQSSLLQRLMEKLFNKGVDKMVNFTFFEQPNDIAVTLTSIKNVSSNRTPPPKIYTPDAACDHLTYFTNPAGLNALIRALYSIPATEASADVATPTPIPSIDPPASIEDATTHTQPSPSSTPIAEPTTGSAIPTAEPLIPIPASEPPLEDSIDELETDEPPDWLSIWIAGFLGFILGAIIVGIAMWSRSSPPQPQKGTNQSLQGDLNSTNN